MAADSPAPLRVARLQVSNFKRISSVDIQPAGRTLVILQGPNEAGKTSALDALVSTLAGKATLPELPIRRGEEVAVVEVELADPARVRYIVQRWCKGDRTGLHVYEVDQDGTRLPCRAQQTLLDSLVSDVSFNPLDFARADRKAQVRLLAAAIGQPDLIDRAEQRKAAVVEQRRQVNAKIVSLKFELNNGCADPAPGEMLAEISPAEVQAQLAAAEAHNAARRHQAQLIQAADVAVRVTDERIAEAEADARFWAERAQFYRQDRARRDADVQLETAKLAAFAPEITTATIAARLQEIDACNARARRQAAHREQAAQLVVAETQADQLTARIGAIDAEVETVIAASDLGRSVPGLSFAAGELLHNGVPFSQASGMRRLELSTLVGMAAVPRLRILCVDEGDQLDDASLARLKELAKERGYALWMTAIRAGDEHDPDTALFRIANGTTQESGATVPSVQPRGTEAPSAPPLPSLAATTTAAKMVPVAADPGFEL